jgi:hypothetical protein
VVVVVVGDVVGDGDDYEVAGRQGQSWCKAAQR